MDSFDTSLFKKSLEEQLRSTPQSKLHWLASVDIAVHDFTEVHGRIPTQHTMTLFFSQATTTSRAQSNSS
eukprot:14889994-Ditylum_brightwellii.AAC.1